MSLALFETLLANPLVVKKMFYYPLIKLQDDFSLHCANDSLAALFIGDKTSYPIGDIVSYHSHNRLEGWW